MRICSVPLLALLSACRPAAPPPAPSVGRALAAEPAARVSPPAAAPAPDSAACCRQCLEASARDPAGMDLRVVPCSRYQGAVFNSGPGVDEACARLLEEQRRTVGSCQNPG